MAVSQLTASRAVPLAGLALDFNQPVCDQPVRAPDRAQKKGKRRSTSLLGEIEPIRYTLGVNSFRMSPLTGGDAL